ncbi:unnamed protein product [Sphagnum balticum]
MLTQAQSYARRERRGRRNDSNKDGANVLRLNNRRDRDVGQHHVRSLLHACVKHRAWNICDLVCTLFCACCFLPKHVRRRGLHERDADDRREDNRCARHETLPCVRKLTNEHGRDWCG